VKVHKGIENFKKIEQAAVTTGTFDGVHLGHRSILNRLQKVARKIRGESVLLTFYPHPRMVLQEDADLKLITTLEEKIALLEETGLDHLIIHPFTKSFSRTSSLEFVRNILVEQMGTKKLVIGYDHHFGRNREGTFEHLLEYSSLYGFEVEEISAKEVDEVNVSSTKIRKALIRGDVTKANSFLGHPFSLHGEVVRGNQLGRTLGFPTANIDLKNDYKLIPAHGVYAVLVRFIKVTYKGMLNIGQRPTLNQKNQTLSIEVHLFDFDENLYGEWLSVDLIGRIRAEKKFDQMEDLVAEMKKDKSKALNILGH